MNYVVKKEKSDWGLFLLNECKRIRKLIVFLAARGSCAEAARTPSLPDVNTMDESIRPSRTPL